MFTGGYYESKSASLDNVDLNRLNIYFCAAQSAEAPGAAPVMGAWDVTFTWTGSNAAQKLLFIALIDGTGTFRMVGPRATNQTPLTHPAVWTRPAQGFMSFTAEVALQTATCCRETGTLLFKGMQTTNGGVISGRAMFVNDFSVVATPGPFQTRVGTFTAVPLPVIAASRRRK
jgi:hypothetical protein